MRPYWSSLAFTCVLLFSSAHTFCQVATGSYDYGTFENRGLDTINVGNLNVHFAIPVINKTGRGLAFDYNLSYDSSVWYPSPVNGSKVWIPVQSFGWKGDTEIATGYLSYGITTVQVGSGGRSGGECIYTYYTDWNYHDTFGVSHQFWGETSHNNDPADCGSYVSTASMSQRDGSGYTLNVTNYTQGTVVAPDGTQFSVPDANYGAGSAIDSNGNEISIDGSGHITDTTGKVALTIAGSAPNPHTFSYTDTNGNAQTATITYTSYTVQTAFGCSGIGEYGPTSVPLVNSITLADGSAYPITYEPTPNGSGHVTGRIASIGLPAGGTISYTYSGGNNGIICGDGSTAGLTRTAAADSGSAASTYTYQRTTGTNTSHTEEVDGLANHSAYDFVQASNQVQSGSTSATTTAVFYETNRKVYQGAESGTPLLSRQVCYNGEAQPCTTESFTIPITQIDTYDTLNGAEEHGSTRNYNSGGFETDNYIYEYGSSSRGSLLEHEVWTYGGSLPSLITAYQTYDGSGNLITKTTSTYDSTSLTTSSGVPQHIAVSGPRGNLTSISYYASSSNALSITNNYEDTGSLLNFTGPNGTYSLAYDSTFVYNTTATPPTPSSGVSLSSAIGFDSTYTGLQTSVTDPNGNAAVSKYNDPLLRVTEVDNPDGGKTTYGYTPTEKSANLYQNSSANTDTELLYDGYGRPSRSAVSNGQATNSWYQVDSCYDADNRPSFVSYTYQGNGWGTGKQCSGTGDSNTYDALGRLVKIAHGDGTSINYSYSGRATQMADENGVTRIVQVDGLNRITSVCEISSNASMPGPSGSPSSCGLDIAGTGFPTTYAYSLLNHMTTVTEGAQTRVFQTDWLGRPILIQEPESGQTTYSYAYNSTGLVVTRIRPKADQINPSTTTATTTQYDSVGRVLSISYTDGTPTKTFAYDSSNGVSTGTGAEFTDLTQLNLKGRLSLAWVSGAGTALSYDPVGRASYLDECLPSGCGTAAYNRQLHYTFDLAGNILTSTDGSSTVTTYSVSRADEVLSMTSSLGNSTNPSDLISNVQNGPDGPVSYYFGNGLSQYNSYDQVGRLNGGWVCLGAPALACSAQAYGFYVNWRGSQIQLSSDDVTGQSNTYGYDEFNRVISMTNGNGQQMYSYVYDRWGNRWQQNVKTGSGPSPQYSFNTAMNQIVGYSYDAAGNMTNDSFHSYTYDGEGNVTAVDGGSTATYVYNALNQRVRTSVGSTATEFVFSAGGHRVSEWSGTTRTQLQGKYYWGGTPVAFYTTGTGAAAHFEHQDWQGTERTRTTYNGAFEGTFTSLPFGDAQSTSSGIDLDPYHFATLDYDSETTTDHAQFRQYNSTEGRWMQPDPYSGSYDFTNPQSLNRYAYVMGAPLSMVDPQGLQPQIYFCGYNDDGSPRYCLDTFGSGTSEEGTAGGSFGGAGGAGGPYWSPACSGPKSGRCTNAWPIVISTAPNNAPTVSHCLGVAAADKGVSIGLDILGAIPAVGNAVSAGAGIVRAGIAVNHVITSPAFAVGSGIYGAYGGVTGGPEEATDSLVGSASAGAGIGLALADVSLAGTKAIPIVGNFVSVATLGWDGYQAYKKYQSCMAGH